MSKSTLQLVAEFIIAGLILLAVGFWAGRATAPDAPIVSVKPTNEVKVLSDSIADLQARMSVLEEQAFMSDETTEVAK